MDAQTAVEAAKSALDLAVIVGFVNAVAFFVPKYTQDSRAKIGLALVAALFLTYVPIGPQISSVINLLFGSSGLYKSLQVVSTLRQQ